MNTIDDSTAVTLGVTSFVVFVLLYVWVALALSALFRKSGEEGWKGWVPILNQITLLQLAGFSGWLVLLGLVPVVNIAYVVVQIMACYRINRSFGFGVGMTVLAAFFLPIWASILGFGTARWLGAEQQVSGPRRSESAALAAPAFAAQASDRRAEYVPLLSATPPAAPAAAPPIAPPVPPAPAVAPLAPSGGWTPPPLPSQPAGSADDDDLEGVDDPIVPVVSSPPPAPPVPQVDDHPTEYNPTFRGDSSAPITAVPASAPVVEPPVKTPPVTRIPAAAHVSDPKPWAPSSVDLGEPEAFDETSGPVSAIAGAPDAGAPRSALTSVSALYTQPEIPADEPIDETVIARRRRTAWSIVPPSGVPVPLTADVVIVGRRPSADAAFPRAQLVSIDDGTISKTHARLVLREDRWYVTDLGSTNGVHFATFMGTEVEATPGVEIEAGDKFILGDAQVRLTRSDS